MIFDYRAELVRGVPTGEKTDDGRDELSDRDQYTSLLCTRPSQRVEQFADTTFVVSDTEFTTRVPKLSDVQIGDRIVSLKSLDDNIFFDIATVKNIFKNRTHLELILELG